MILGFHSISLLLHDETTAINELAKIGYRAVALQPRLGGLDPSSPHFVENMLRFINASQQLNLKVVLDLDACFMHAPSEECGPSLASRDVDQATSAQVWIEKWIDIAHEHGIQLLTFSSGAASDELGPTDETTLEQLAMRMSQLLDKANQLGIQLALRPLAGHAVSMVSQFERFRHWLDESEGLLLAADVGTMATLQEQPIAARLSRCFESLACVYLNEPACDQSELVLGTVDFSLVVAGLRKSGFQGPAIFRPSVTAEQALKVAGEMLPRLS